MAEVQIFPNYTCLYIHTSGEAGLGVKVVANGKVILHSLNHMSYGLKVQSNCQN